ncbi:hypothetical protein ACFLVH_04515 [Chloroflexota bacterium]
MLKELSGAEDLAAARSRAAEFLKKVDAKTLSLAEQELRAKKKKLAELAEQAGSISFSEFSRELSEVGNYIANALSDHIYKEDNILYTTALETLESGEWPKVAKEFDSIGYCYFTPTPPDSVDSVGERRNECLSYSTG